jgi:hypothetical protein
MTRLPHATVCFVFLLGASCAEDNQLKDRMKTIQDNRKAESLTSKDVRLELMLSTGKTQWCPSSSAPTYLRATVYSGNKAARTPLSLESGEPGGLPFGALAATLSAGSLGPEWLMVAPPLAPALAGKKVTVEAHLLNNPAASATLVLAPTFDCDQVSDFRGRSGRPGAHGENGEKGLSVSAVVAYITAATGERLIMARVTPANGAASYHALTPGHHLGVDVRGGTGGQGQGGYAAAGAGLAGDGGDGGTVEVSYDQSFPELREVVLVANVGGKGGEGADGSASYAGRPGRPGPTARYAATREIEKLFRDEIEQGLKITRHAP